MITLKSSVNHEWPWAKRGDEAESVFQKTYPALHAHMAQYRDRLIARQDQGEFWWELRACSYWDKFYKPKFLMQRFAYYWVSTFVLRGRAA